MRRLLQTAIAAVITIACIVTLAVRPVDAGPEFVSLSQLAPKLGLSYTWIASESAVALTRPGLYVLVRTGNPLYDVNDSVESTAPAPAFHNNDLYIGAALAARLRSLAAKYTPRAPMAKDMDVSAPMSAPVHGSLTLNVVPTAVSDAVLVSGSGPANVPLAITLSADIARDLPRVLLSRTDVRTDSAGRFSVQISTSPLHLQKSLVLVSATSVSGVSEAHTSFVLGQASPNIAHPIDELPRDFRPHR